MNLVNLRDFLGAATKLKESIFKFVQLKVWSTFFFNLLFLIVFVFDKVDALFLKFCTVPTTSGEFVPQYLACCVGHCKGEVFRNSIYPQSVNMILGYLKTSFKMVFL